MKTYGVRLKRGQDLHESIEQFLDRYEDYKGQRKVMQIRIIQSARRSISIEIKLDEMIVRAPKGMSRKQIDDFLYKKRSWIEKHSKIMEEKKAYLDKVKPLTKEEIQALADKACKVIPKKVRYYAPLVGVDYGRITIRNQKTRWGSCSSKGNLNFNYFFVYGFMKYSQFYCIKVF